MYFGEVMFAFGIICTFEEQFTTLALPAAPRENEDRKKILRTIFVFNAIVFSALYIVCVQRTIPPTQYCYAYFHMCVVQY